MLPDLPEEPAVELGQNHRLDREREENHEQIHKECCAVLVHVIKQEVFVHQGVNGRLFRRMGRIHIFFRYTGAIHCACQSD